MDPENSCGREGVAACCSVPPTKGSTEIIVENFEAEVPK